MNDTIVTYEVQRLDGDTWRKISSHDEAEHATEFYGFMTRVYGGAHVYRAIEKETKTTSTIIVFRGPKGGKG